MVVGLWSAVRAQDAAPASAGATLFQNVRIFDGSSNLLATPSSVLVKGNIIERISAASIAADPGVTVVAGGGRTLMPGLIDNHWHAMLARVTPAQALGDVGFNNLVAGDEATDTLMRGLFAM
jgi:imidazolonepropionase-like amidohydrolase